MDANLSMEQIRMDVKNVTALNQEGYDWTSSPTNLIFQRTMYRQFLPVHRDLQKMTQWLLLFSSKQVYNSYIDKKCYRHVW